MPYSNGFERIRNLSELERLELPSTKITDAILVKLKAFPNLRKLDLLDTNVTDNGVADLVGLDRLEDLDLRETNVTDQCLAILKNLKTLKHLSLPTAGGMIITGDGIVKFKQALPKCEVTWENFR